MKRTIRFLRQYALLSLAVWAVLVGLGLELAGQHHAATWLLGVVAITAVIPLLWGMWRDLQTGTYGIDVLAATAIIVSVILGQAWAAIIVVLMLTGGESLEAYAEHRARTELDTLLANAPRKANVIRKGKTLSVAVDEIHTGDKLVIRAGELVPVDAVISDGTASFDESSLTGESLPQSKQAGDQLLSGSINLDGEVTAKAVASAADSQYQQIIRLVRGAAATQAPFVRLADRYAVPFTFLAFALALGVWLWTGEAIRFLEVIIVATPCPLILAAPIALVSGMSRASRYGIIVKTGSALERLAEARTIAFDKTGTLTRGQLVVQQVTAYSGFTKQEVLQLAASLEQSSNHVVAQAIVNAALQQNVRLAKAKHVQEVSGRGVRAMVKGAEVLVGRFSLLAEHDVAVPAKFAHSEVKQTAAFVAIDGQLAGIVTLADEIRPEAKETIERLHGFGIQNVLMVTGDNQATAASVAKQLGIDTVHAETLPADKLHLIEKIEHKPVAFVGDGVNDAPVLTAATVGIALGARGSAAAAESADMVIMLDDVKRVAGAYAIARRTFQIARQSILAGIALSLGLMAAFATGKFSPLLGALLQEVVDVVVIFNALRAHLITLKDV